MRTRTFAAFVAAAGALALMAPSTLAAAALVPQPPAEAVFTLSALTTGVVTVPLGSSASSARAVAASDAGVAVLTDGTESAVADLSLRSAGALSAATSSFVDLSWSAVPGVHEYVVLENGKLIGRTADLSFRDLSVSPGPVYYVVQTVNPTAEFSGRTWGLSVTVPDAKSTDSAGIVKAAGTQTTALAAASYSKTIVQWQTFIPQAQIDAPPVGCDYGNGYAFKGDNRGYLASGYPYRTKVQANITWSSSSMVASNGIGTTHVIKKSTGAVVDQATASSSGLTVSKLSGTTSTMDLRFNTKAGNPFCSANSIDGAFTITVTKAGSYSIISGSHRQMPNHEVYISNGSNWVTVYKKNYLDPICLVSMACASAQMGGTYGTY